MSDTEKKALTLVNEVRAERSGYPQQYLSRRENQWFEALCRAIEQHEAFRQEVSDAIQALKKDVGTGWDHCRPAYACNRFIIAKPDPLVEAWIEATGNTVGMEPLNAALAKRGGKIVWREGH